MTAIADLTDADFETEVLSSSQPVVVEFWAPWCGPCRQVGPVLHQIAEERRDQLRVVKINQDEQPLTSARYRVLGLPTVMVFAGGELVGGFTGARSKSAMDREIDRALDSRRD